MEDTFKQIQEKKQENKKNILDVPSRDPDPSLQDQQYKKVKNKRNIQKKSQKSLDLSEYKAQQTGNISQPVQKFQEQNKKSLIRQGYGSETPYFKKGNQIISQPLLNFSKQNMISGNISKKKISQSDQQQQQKKIKKEPDRSPVQFYPEKLKKQQYQQRQQKAKNSENNVFLDHSEQQQKTKKEGTLKKQKEQQYQQKQKEQQSIKSNKQKQQNKKKQKQQQQKKEQNSDEILQKQTTKLKITEKQDKQNLNLDISELQKEIDLTNLKSIVDKTERYYPNILSQDECEKQYKLGVWANNKCWKDPEYALCESTKEETPQCKYNPYSGKYISTKYLESQPENLIAISEQGKVDMQNPKFQKRILQYFTGQLSTKMPVYQNPLATEFIDACNQSSTTAGNSKNQPTVAQSLMNIVGQIMIKYPQDHRGVLCFHSLGSGKSLARGTLVLMYNGKLEKVENIKIGDQVMGDDSTPRNVVDLGRGREQMYEVIPVKGERYTVNQGHILCLKYSRNGFIKYDPRDKKKQKTPYAVYFNKNTYRTTSKAFKTRKEAQQFIDSLTEEHRTFEISLNDYLQLPKYIKDYLKGYRTGVEFSSRNVDFDPYIIGVWLGDGTATNTQITSQSHNIIKYLHENLRQYNLFLDHQKGYHYKVLPISHYNEDNIFMQILRKHKLIKNKHIPDLYKINNRQTRLKLFAGIIDTDGYLAQVNNCYDIVQKSKQLSDDILYLARSLGFAAYVKYTNKACTWKGKRVEGWYYRMSISGEGLDEIPVQIRRKKAHKRGQIKNALVTGIKVVPVGVDDYYGIRLDGNHKYLLGDFTVTHNTCTSTAIMDSYWDTNKKIYYITTFNNLKSVSPQEYRDCIRLFPKFKNLSKEEAEKKFQQRNVQFLSFQQAANLLGIGQKIKNSSIDAFKNSLLLIDEVQNIFTPISTQKEGFEKLKKFFAQKDSSHLSNTHIYGLTATPGNTPEQIVQLINMFRGPTQTELQVPTTDLEFEEFQKEILGMISYIDNRKDFTRFPRVYNDDYQFVEMSEQQFKTYREKLQDLKKIFKKETDYQVLEKENQVDEYYKTLRRYSNMVLNYISTDNLETYSHKLAAIINKIQQFPNDKQYIYSAFFIERGNFGGQGIRSIGYALKKFAGYEQVTIRDFYEAYIKKQKLSDFLTPGQKRFFLLLTPEFEKHKIPLKYRSESRMFLNYFNDPENSHGEYIQLMLTSGKFNEGLDLKDVQHIHIFEPFVQKAADEQAIGRAARSCSHKNLKFPQEWIVQVHRYISDFPSTYQLVDSTLLQTHINRLQEKNKELAAYIQQLYQHIDKSYANQEGNQQMHQQIQTWKLNIQNNDQSIKITQDQLQKIEKEGNLIPIDYEIFRISQLKYGTLRKIYQIIQNSAIDCILLNKLANYPSDCYLEQINNQQVQQEQGPGLVQYRQL